MAAPSYEARVNLALTARQRDPNLSNRKAARIYQINKNTLQNRHAGKPTRRDTPANSQKLTDQEESSIIRYITKLYTHTFPPQLRFVGDMANRLLHERNTPPVGKL
jgi:hypothetical protein